MTNSIIQEVNQANEEGPSRPTENNDTKKNEDGSSSTVVQNNIPTPPSVVSRLITASGRRPYYLSVLIVGDGDFSGSLAILRAYGSHIRSMTVTSLVSSATELIALYPHAKEIVKELQAFQEEDSSSSQHYLETAPAPRRTTVTILFGVDATKLHCDERILQKCRRLKDDDGENKCLDYIMFQHPHIGYDDDTVLCGGEESNYCEMGRPSSTTTVASDKNKHAILAAKHSSLLAEYFFSARQLTILLHKKNHPSKRTEMKDERVGGGDDDGDDNSEPLIHVSLCAGQSKNWKLYPTLRRIGLELVGRPGFASKPLWPHLKEANARMWKDDADDDSRLSGNDNDKGGSGPSSNSHHYWLSRYGYHHQATYPSTTRLSTVVNSHHYFFRIVPVPSDG